MCTPTANLTNALLVPEALFGGLVKGSSKCAAPESHRAKGSHGSFIKAPWMLFSDKEPTETACN
eukprot:5047334-Prorocentrum_lima.AAC.1